MRGPKIHFFGWLAFAVTQGLFVPNPEAAALPQGFTEMKLAGSLNPSAMEVAPDGRVFICQKDGKVRVIKNGILLGAPFLSINVDPANERGLLGIAFDPAFSANHFVYVYYTVVNPAHNRIGRYVASGDTAIAAETVILDLENLGASNHNGGAIHFGTDGKLYAAVGNNVVNSNSQSLTTLLGKILRLNPDGTIPTDNPFYNTATGNYRAIWALGLRNPFTTAIEPGTGRIFINDVGENTYEEINDGLPMSNYGWSLAEGNGNPTVQYGTYRNPVYFYDHTNACAIVGGTFYRPASVSFPNSYAGLYFFSDYCGGWIKTLNTANGNAVATFATGIARPIDLKVGADGSLYYLTRGIRDAAVGSGSVQDNTSTSSGELYQVKSTVTALTPSRGNPSLFALSQPGQSFLLPQNARGASLFDLSGKKVWEFRKQGNGDALRVALPAALGLGLFRVRYY